MLKPRFIVLDEPTSALDMSVQAQIVDLLRDLQRRHKLAYLFISHDLKVVRALADEVVVLRDGKVVERGPAKQIFDAAADALHAGADRRGLQSRGDRRGSERRRDLMQGIHRWGRATPVARSLLAAAHDARHKAKVTRLGVARPAMIHPIERNGDFMAQAIAYISRDTDGVLWKKVLEADLGPIDFRRLDSAWATRPTSRSRLPGSRRPGCSRPFPNLKLIVSLGMGVDHLLSDDKLPARRADHAHHG